MEKPWYHTVGSHIGEGWNQVIIQALKKAKYLDKFKKGEFVLDVGCAEGGLSLEMVNRGGFVIALENDPVMIERQRIVFKDTNPDAFTVIQADLNTYLAAQDFKHFTFYHWCFFLNISHHLNEPIAFFEWILKERMAKESIVVTNGFSIDTSYEQKNGRTKMSTGLVCEMLKKFKFVPKVLGTYRENRELVVGER